jgi:surface protein
MYLQQEMFHEATSFNQDLSQWDTSKNVTDMCYMFDTAVLFNQDISLCMESDRNVLYVSEGHIVHLVSLGGIH